MIYNSSATCTSVYREPLCSLICLEAGTSFLEGSFGEPNHPGEDIDLDPENIFDL